METNSHPMPCIGGLSVKDVWVFENAYHWFSAPSRMDKVLAQYELYKRITSLPGHILELGVYKANSLIRLAGFRRLLETETSRNIVAFDAFGKFPIPEDNAGDQAKQDRDYIRYFENVGGDGLSLEEVHAILNLKGIENIELVDGDILETLPKWVEHNPQVRIALLHIDLDVYKPAKLAMNLLWSRMVPGGLVIFDDYGAVAGETQAIDEFLRCEGVGIEKMPYYSVPSYVVKPLQFNTGGASSTTRDSSDLSNTAP